MEIPCYHGGIILIISKKIYLNNKKIVLCKFLYLIDF